MKNTFLFIILNAIFVFTSNAQNKIDGNNQRKGEWIISYKGDFEFIDYNEMLLNPSTLLQTSRESNLTTETTYFEKATYKKGIKNGLFQIFDKDMKLIAEGTYINGIINGNFSVAYKGVCNALYNNGKLIDQTITIQYVRGSWGNWEEVRNVQNMFKDEIQIKNGKCIKQIITKGENFRIKILSISDDKITLFQSGIESSRNPKELQVLYPKIYDYQSIGNNFASTYWEVADLDLNMKYHGFRTIYREKEYNSIPFDSTILLCRIPYVHGQKHGTEYWYFPEPGADKKLLMELNYLDGKLNGVSTLYSKNGSKTVPFIEASYQNGLLNGSFVTYFIGNSKITLKGPLCQTEINKINWVYHYDEKFYDDQNRKISTYEYLISINEPMFSQIPGFRNDGHNILTNGSYKFFEATYKDGIIQNNFKYFHSNGGTLYEAQVQDCIVIDWKWMDQNGKVFFDKRIHEENNKKKQELQNKALLEQYNSEIPCAACNKPILYRNSKTNNGECKCIQKDGKPITVLTSEAKFCSIQCKTVYETDECLQNGYRH